MKRCLFFLLSGVMVALGIVFGATPALAHGATTVQVDGDYGPYHVVVTTNPGSDAKQVLMTVLLSLKVDNSQSGYDQVPQPVSNAKVRATFTRIGRTTPELVSDLPLETTRTVQGYYERTVSVPSEGEWQVTLDVSSPSGSASTTFAMSLRNPTTWVQVAEWAAAGAIVIFVFLYMRGMGAPKVTEKDTEKVIEKLMEK
jgi:hypothetical protein